MAPIMFMQPKLYHGAAWPPAGLSVALSGYLRYACLLGFHASFEEGAAGCGHTGLSEPNVASVVAGW